jgi:hypothetical protein
MVLFTRSAHRPSYQEWSTIHGLTEWEVNYPTNFPIISEVRSSIMMRYISPTLRRRQLLHMKWFGARNRKSLTEMVFGKLVQGKLDIGKVVIGKVVTQKSDNSVNAYADNGKTRPR